MAGAFLSDALRQQAREQEKNKHMQEIISQHVAKSLISQLAQQKMGQGVSDRGREAGVRSSAAERSMQTEIGKTRLEMQQEIAAQQEQLGLITAAASAVGTLGAYYAKSIGEEDPTEGLPDIKDTPSYDEMVSGSRAPGIESPGSGKQLGEGFSLARAKEILERQKAYQGIHEAGIEEELLAAMGGSFNGF